MKIFENYDFHRINWRFACFVQFFDDLLPKTNCFITEGKYNQDKMVILIIRTVLQFVCEIKVDTQCIVLDLWNFGMHLCSNKK